MVKAKQNIGIIKHLNKFLPFKTLNQMCKALVRSHLEYCDIIYHITSIMHNPPLGTSLNYLMEKVEKMQYQACYRCMAGIGSCEALRGVRMGISLWSPYV